MPTTVYFNDEMIAQAASVAPTFKFSDYVKTAVREKLHRDKLLNAPLQRLSDGERS